VLTITEDDLHDCLLLEPAGALTRRDLAVLAEQFQAREAATGRAPNLVVRADSFPTWTEVAALVQHLRFIRGRHRRVRRVALVSDARAMEIAPRLARVLVAPEVRHFPGDRLDAALAWVGSATRA
jgi:hypothetical protein